MEDEPRARSGIMSRYSLCKEEVCCLMKGNDPVELDPGFLFCLFYLNLKCT